MIDTLASPQHNGLEGTHLTDIASNRRVQAQGVSRLGEHDQALQQAGLHLLDDSMASFFFLLLSPTWLFPSDTPPRRGPTPSITQLDGTARECHGTIPESTCLLDFDEMDGWRVGVPAPQSVNATLSPITIIFNQRWREKTTRR